MAKWTAADLPDMTGKTVLVTGAGSGIGLVTAREFGRVGARVVLGVRSIEKGRRAITGMPGDFDVRRLDDVFAEVTAGARLAAGRVLLKTDTQGYDLEVLAGASGVLDRIVAVKVIKPWWAEDPAWADAFEREARILARVSDPGIVQIFDVGQAREGDRDPSAREFQRDLELVIGDGERETRSVGGGTPGTEE